VAFYYVIDETGPNVWAQWDGVEDPLMLSLNLGNFLLEVGCFSPAANLIFIVVDDSGRIHTIGRIPEMDIDQAVIQGL
jgi:hypothetical protein